MKNIADTIEKFIPLLIQFPKWIQICFFLVIFQIILLVFISAFYYVMYIKNPKTKDTKSAEKTISKTAETTTPSDSSSSDAYNKLSDINIEITEIEINKIIQSDDISINAVTASLSNLAAVFEAQGRFEEAEKLLLRIIKIKEKAFGLEHPDLATTLNNLSILYVNMGRLMEAENYQKIAVEIVRKTLGDKHPTTATYFINLASIYLKLSKYDLAASFIEKALSIRTVGSKNDHPSIIPMLENLAKIYQQAGNSEKYQELTDRINKLNKPENQEGLSG